MKFIPMGKLPESHNPTVTNGGFSLLGVVVSLSLLTVGIVASASVTARTEHAIGISRDRLVAINLAREGLELVQAQRDSNWGAQRTNPTDPNSVWYFQLCDQADPTAPDHTFTMESEATPAIVTGTSSGQLFLDNNGWYTHTSGTVTPFSRVIMADCRASTVVEPSIDGRFIELTSKVTWNSRGVDRDVELKTRLYDWDSPI